MNSAWQPVWEIIADGSFVWDLKQVTSNYFVGDYVPECFFVGPRVPGSKNNLDTYVEKVLLVQLIL